VRYSVRRAILVALTVVSTVLAGCTQVVPGRPGAVEPQPEALPMDPGSVAVRKVQAYWSGAFEQAFDQRWHDVMDAVPVHTDDPRTTEPPCVRNVSDVAGQAFYCPSADVVAWDADGLLPDLEERFGQAGVLVVLAHEIGHAVQNRLGVDAAQAQDPDRYPTILLEAMADCYAGTAVAELTRHPDPDIPLGPVERDSAMLALVNFRDPLGVEPTNASAHGNAFDRVSAFQDGYLNGPRRCAGMSLANREFTQRRFGDAEDLARGGDLPLDDLLASVERDARLWFADSVPGYLPPRLNTPGSCDPTALFLQGPTRFCAADGTVSFDRYGLSVLYDQLGDYAIATLIVSRYALAALAAADLPTTGPDATAAALCLTGAYTSGRIEPRGGFTLSPGDLDEAVTLLLRGDWAARDDAGRIRPGETGFDRVSHFRDGLLDGPDGCLRS
jgi:hypothetical protein